MKKQRMGIYSWDEKRVDLRGKKIWHVLQTIYKHPELFPIKVINSHKAKPTYYKLIVVKSNQPWSSSFIYMIEEDEFLEIVKPRKFEVDIKSLLE